MVQRKDLISNRQPAYDEVAKYNEDDLRNFLEEVTNAGKSKHGLALALLRKEEDALREESSSGDDTGHPALRRRSKKLLIGRREQSSGDQQSAAACTSTGGSLGSLHDLSETKPKKVVGQSQGVASRCREGGSCGNLSRGSFETQPPRKRKGRRYRDAARASTSQREGGSLQNLSKTEAASNESKKLHKSGSLSQVCSEVASGARSKNRRQKTASESSSSRYSRRSEEREGEGSSGDEGAVEVPYRRLEQSPHSTLSTHSAEHTFPPEGVGGAKGGHGPDCNHDIEDSMSTLRLHVFPPTSQDVDSQGETTEEEVDAKEEPCRSLGGLSRARHCSEAPIEEDGIELQSISCQKADSDNPHTEVDRTIKFNLGRPQEDTMPSSCGRRTLSLQDSPCVSSVFKEEKTSSKSSEEEGIGKRKLLGGRSDSSGSENKASLDENSNPMITGGAPSLLTSAAGTDRSSSTFLMSTHTTSRRNGISGTHKQVTKFEQLKTKKEKKKASREKDIVNIIETPGFRGDQDVNDLLKFIIGSDEDTPNSKNKKKHKGKGQENRDEKEGSKKSKNKSSRASEDSWSEKWKEDEGSAKTNDDSGIGGEVTARENNRKSKEREDEKKTANNKKNKNQDTKKGKKGSSSLRESSSVEDLVSKSKQSDNVRDIRKQVTIDDGDMSLSVLHTYQNNKKVDKFNHFIANGKYIRESSMMDIANDNEFDTDQRPSDFVTDFYSVGDSFLGEDLSRAPSSPSGGDFEVVSKKRSKRAKNNPQNASQSVRNAGSERWSGSTNSGGHVEDSFRSSRFGQNKPNHRGNGSHERPHINFVEGPRTVHENMFLAQWSQLGVGAGERYAATTTSAPHSEDSESDGDDSVHSMPVPSITPRPDVRKPPPSSDSTPQASYANIAKLAASANRTQMKRVGTVGAQSGTAIVKEVDGEVSGINVVEHSTSRPQVACESRPSNILDDNFPSLAESLGGSAPISAISTFKQGESRTNHLSESVVIPVNNASTSSVSDLAKERPGVTEASSSPRESGESVVVSTASLSGQVTSDKKQIKCIGENVQLNTQSVQQHSHPQQSHHPHTLQHPLHSQPTQHAKTHYYMQPQHLVQHQPISPHQPQQPRQTPLQHPNQSPIYPQPNHPQQTAHQKPSSQLQTNSIQPIAKTSPSPSQISQNMPPPQQSQLAKPVPTQQQQNPQQPQALLPHTKTSQSPLPQPSPQPQLSPQPQPSIHTQSSHPQQVLSSQHNLVSQQNLHRPQSSHTLPGTYPAPSSLASQNTNANSVAVRETSEEKQIVSGKSQGKQTKNGSVGPTVQSGDTSRFKKIEPAVVFTDNAKFNHSVSGLEFGFGFDESIVTTSDNNGSGNESVVLDNEDNKCNNNNNNILKNNHTVTKDFSKCFKAPKNDKISYNYEELIRHVSKAWEVTLRLMEEDPKNIQYWRAASTEES
ncbi:myb-like protein X isoform X3 [Penaeus vannamei]|uniref:myb-like protein X isoform X3 n=1 Tax=Penaeus vannamei TaxID=6689 RepID=UPI000F66AA80|nr:uncharacterized protein LOC113803171 isoform X3 [Penaeus vannamei]